MFELTTTRLRLREMTRDDLDAMCAYWTDPATMHRWPSVPTREQVTQIIDHQIDSYAARNHGGWAVELRSDGTLIGDCGLWHQELSGNDVVELGYHFSRTSWGHGYASEAARACVDEARRLGIERLVSLIMPDNVESQRVAQAVGMTTHGMVKRPERDGVLHDVWQMQVSPAHTAT